MSDEMITALPISSNVHGRRDAISLDTGALCEIDQPRSPWARSER